jgi:hypothetical protein
VRRDGLRGRIFLVVSGVALLAVVAVAVRGRDVAVVAFEREVRGPGAPEPGPRLTAFQGPLEEAYARSGDWRGAQELLAKLAAGRDGRYLLADWWGRWWPRSRLLRGSDAAHAPDGGVEVTSSEGGETRVSV